MFLLHPLEQRELSRDLSSLSALWLDREKGQRFSSQPPGDHKDTDWFHKDRIKNLHYVKSGANCV